MRVEQQQAERRGRWLHKVIFVSALAIGALLRTVPYAILGQGLSSGSIVTILIAGASAGLGGIAAVVLLRQLRRTPAAAA